MSHLSLCPTLPVCPSFAPVLCPGKFCMPTLADCPELPPCPPHAPYRCPSGECVEYAATCAPGIRCPIIETCPTGYLMCYDGSCVDHNSVCLPPPVCPSLSIRCLDGSCRSAVNLEGAVLDYFGAAPAYETCVSRKLEESSVEIEKENQS